MNKCPACGKELDCLMEVEIIGSIVKRDKNKNILDIETSDVEDRYYKRPYCRKIRINNYVDAVKFLKGEKITTIKLLKENGKYE